MIFPTCVKCVNHRTSSPKLYKIYTNKEIRWYIKVGFSTHKIRCTHHIPGKDTFYKEIKGLRINDFIDDFT